MKDKRSHSALETSKDMLSFEIFVIVYLNYEQFISRRMTHPAERGEERQ